MDGVLVMDAESFPLPLRSGGCFLVPDDTDTPKARQFSLFGSAPLPYTGVVCSSNQGQVVAGQPASPSVFSPSKSFSEAISASASFAHTLRNYFAPDASPSSFGANQTSSEVEVMQQPQRLPSQARSSPPTGRLSGSCQPCLPPLQRHLFSGLPPVKTKPSGFVLPDAGHSAVYGGCILPTVTSLLEVRAAVQSTFTGSTCCGDEDQTQWLDSSSQHCLFVPASNTLHMDFADLCQDQLVDHASDSDQATPAALDLNDFHFLDSERSQVLHASAAAAAALVDVAGVATLTDACLTASGDSGSVGTAIPRCAKRSAAVLESDGAGSGSEEGSEDIEEHLEEHDEEEGEDDEDDDEVHTATLGRKRHKVSRGSKAGKKRAVTFYKGKRVVCLNCSAQQTPQWREGPEGPRTLCNACGVRYKKGLPLAYWEAKKKQQHHHHLQQQLVPSGL